MNGCFIRRAIYAACLMAYLSAGLFGQVAGTNNLVVTRLTVDSALNQIDIIGENFLSSNGRQTPSVFLGRQLLNTIGVTTQSHIIAQLPTSLGAGMYLLTVSNGNGSSQFFSTDLTVGATGPAGPAGLEWDSSP